MDGILSGHSALAQSQQLRKDEPHPVALLLSCAQLGQRLCVNRRLRGDEALQAHTPAFFAETSPMAAQSLSCQPQATAWSKCVFSSSAVGMSTPSPSAALRARFTSFNPRLRAKPAGS